jgi:excinuclease ABC subunit A
MGIITFDIETANIIDLGPEGGAYGGELIYAGTPEGILREKRSHTGKCLKRYIKHQ